MKKIFLIIYGLVVLAVTIGFVVLGEHPRDSRFYLSILVLFLIGRLIGKWIDGREDGRK